MGTCGYATLDAEMMTDLNIFKWYVVWFPVIVFFVSVALILAVRLGLGLDEDYDVRYGFKEPCDM